MMVPELRFFIAAAICFFLPSILFFPAKAFSEQGKALSLSGSYRNLLFISETASDRSYYLDSNRIRIVASGEPSEVLSYTLKYDNNLTIGNYLSTGEFAAAEAAGKSQPRQTYWDMDEEISRRGEMRWGHSIHRGYINVRKGSTDVRLGRQRVPWGRGWFFSPLDIFNPISPTAIDRGERSGIDGVLMEFSRGMSGRAALLYLPQQSFHDSFAARAETLYHSYDLAISLGRHRDVDFYGLDFSGYIGDAGFKGEFVFSNEDGQHRESLLLSGNYTFENTLYIMLEYFRYEGGSLHPINYSGEDYGGLNIGYELTPLIRWDNYLILNLSDGSMFFSPALTYSVKENMELRFGLQFFAGSSSDEYGDKKDSGYAEFDCYF